MILLKIVLAATSWLPSEAKQAGLLLVARLGRYAQDAEREAAFFLPFLRSAPLENRRCYELIQDDSREILEILLNGTPSAQVRRIARNANWSAGRVLYCELLETSTQLKKKDPHAGLSAQAQLAKLLTPEMLEGIKLTPLKESDVPALFAARQKAVLFYAGPI